MDAWLENTPFCHAVLVLGLKRKNELYKSEYKSKLVLAYCK